MQKACLHIFSGTVVFLVLFYSSVGSIFANTEYQHCAPESSCVIGEFLYDDSYSPIATAACTLTARNPDGTVYLNAVPMTAQADGWYSHEFTAPATTGLYRAQVCCTADTDYLCLDKTFEISAAAGGSSITAEGVADAVWDEQRSEHTQAGSFGEALQNKVPSTTQLSDAVWGHSSRSLTGFGSLISDIWGYATRSTTASSAPSDTANLAKKTDIDALKKEVLYNQSLLEKLANKPIVKNYLELEEEVDLQSKLNQSESQLSSIQLNSYAMDNSLRSITESWVTIENDQLLATMQEVADASETIASSARLYTDLWELDEAKNISTQAGKLKDRVAIIQNELSVEEKSSIALSDIKTLRESVNAFIPLVGMETDTAEKSSLYAHLNQKKQLANKLDLYSAEADKLLSNWNALDASEIQDQSQAIAVNLASVNQLPKKITVLNEREAMDVMVKLKNRVLAMVGIMDANRVLLAKKTNAPFSSSWLEEGSVFFKTLITNPSAKISQAVPLKYYLPTELQKEDILEISDGLTTNYDVDKKQLYVEGEFLLAASESKVVFVRVEDIWSISDESLESLRHQTEELVKPLAKTSYYGQSVTIKSNIDVILDKIALSQKTAVTPEAKIKNYYEAQIELVAVKEQIAKLQDMVTESGSMGTLTGFVGGAQTIAVWGMIIIMVTGFVFLVLYMRVLSGRELKRSTQKADHRQGDVIDQVVEIEEAAAVPQLSAAPKPQKKRSHGTAHLIALVVLCSLLSSATTGASLYWTFLRQDTPEVAQVAMVTPTPSTTPGKVSGVMDEVRTAEAASPLASISAAIEATKSSEATSAASLDQRQLPKPEPVKMLLVRDTPTQFLNVRSRPSLSSEVVTQVYPGERYQYTEVLMGWYKITLADGSEGWISGVYITAEK